MPKFICFLRSVNVGGNNKIKMDALREVFENIGFAGVQTYIQSGNVIFESEDDRKTIIDKIHEGIEQAFGLSVDSAVRDIRELETIIRDCPYSQKHDSDMQSGSNINKLYLGISKKNISPEDLIKAEKHKAVNEEYSIAGDDIYLWLDEGMGTSKFAKGVLKISPSITIRNWSTINKIFELMKQKA